MRKNLDSSFSTSLNDGAQYADKNESKQPQVCIKNLGITANSSFQVFVKVIEILGGLGNPNNQYFSKIFHTWCFNSEWNVLEGQPIKLSKKKIFFLPFLKHPSGNA